MKRILIVALIAAFAGPLQAAEEHYRIDTEGTHAFIEFRIQHLGYSWLYGRFNDFQGHFVYDTEDPSNSSVEVDIDPASVDTNHDRRDEHLRSDDFLHVAEYPAAGFKSTSFSKTGEDTYVMTGDLTLHGVTREVEIDVEQIGAGEDPWGGYRRGFLGTTTLTLADFGIDYDLGPSARTVELTLSIEGIRQEADSS